MTAIFAYILAHAFTWLRKLAVLLVFDSLFRAFLIAGFLDPVLKIAWYVQNNSLFRIIPENGIVWTLNVFSFLISVEVILYIIGREHLPNNSHASKETPH